MADEDDNGGGALDEGSQKCEKCVPGLPGWMATFSDMVTLLLTFFVLLLSFAKTETSKYEAALGSLRKAFGGNVLKQGEVIQMGKSPDNSPTMLESQEPIKPFPIEFLTSEGLLDKHEINRESAENLKLMQRDLKDFELNDAVDVYETKEGIMVRLKDKIYFEEGSVEIKQISVEVFTRLVKMLGNRDWTVFVEGHASKGEVSTDRTLDAFTLSAKRTEAVTRSLIRRGVRAHKISPVFYGDTRPDGGIGERAVGQDLNRRVEFIIRKVDLRTEGHKVNAQ